MRRTRQLEVVQDHVEYGSQVGGDISAPVSLCDRTGSAEHEPIVARAGCIAACGSAADRIRICDIIACRGCTGIACCRCTRIARRRSFDIAFRR